MPDSKLVDELSTQEFPEENEGNTPEELEETSEEVPEEETPEEETPEETPEEASEEAGEEEGMEKAYEIPGVGEVTEDELVKGYLRQADYTRKTQELAQMRRALEDAYKLLQEQARQQVAPTAEAEAPPPPSPLEDERGFTQWVRSYVNTEVRKALDELQNVRQTLEQDRVRLRAEMQVERAVNMFAASHPDLSDEEIDQVVEIAAQRLSPTMDEAGNITPDFLEDAYAIYLVKSGRLAEERRQGRREVIRKVKSAPKTLRGRGGSAPRGLTLEDLVNMPLEKLAKLSEEERIAIARREGAA